jgi:hypothetical protein
LKFDRGQTLEAAWVEKLIDPNDPDGDPPLAQTFNDLKAWELQGRRPSLVFTPMLIEDSRRLVLSNLDLRYAISNDGPVITRSPSEQGAENLSIDAVQFFRLFPEVHKTFRLSTAIRMSASFPFFSPAVSLPTKPRRRVVDAGYYDNYGVTLAASWLFGRDIDNWREAFDRVLIIQIRDGVTEKARQLRSAAADGSSFLSRSMEEMTSPPEGMYNATFGSSSFRNDGLLELYKRFHDLRRKVKGVETGPGPKVKRQARLEWREEPFMVVNIEFNEKASLSWYLSDDEKQRIKADGEKLREKGELIDKLIQWWENPTKNESP